MHPNSPPPKHIVIAGGGSAGWMTASILLRSLGLVGSKITLIESPNIPTIGVGEGTTPLFKRFLKFLEVPEEEFMGACKATYKHGIEFPGWTGRKEFSSNSSFPIVIAGEKASPRIQIPPISFLTRSWQNSARRR
jgi:2-polyprenyl-6-methoxyphenol hydroxylase-like FAD-dependent oxidoreductase